jgi:hypothetical protein
LPIKRQPLNTWLLAVEAPVFKDALALAVVVLAATGQPQGLPLLLVLQ